MDQSQMMQLKRMLDVASKSTNPNSMLEMMAKTNPQLQQVLTDISELKMSPKDVFYKKAHDMGMTDKQIDEFIAQLQSLK